MLPSLLRSLVKPVCVAMLVVALLPESGMAQRPLTVQGRRDLRFGQLLPGVSTQVPFTDTGGAGLFRIRGGRNLEVTFIMTLPSSMDDGVGNTVPLTFVFGDAGYSRNNPSNAVPFDPNVPQTVTLPNSGRINIFLGGQATPAPTQAAGAYSGLISLAVTYVGT